MIEIALYHKIRNLSTLNGHIADKKSLVCGEKGFLWVRYENRYAGYDMNSNGSIYEDGTAASMSLGAKLGQMPGFYVTAVVLVVVGIAAGMALPLLLRYLGITSSSPMECTEFRLSTSRVRLTPVLG